MVIKCKKNYYDILGVTPDSDFAEVKSSYRFLARKFHPDVNKDPDSARIFKDVLEAYETLSDETKRKQYDMINGFYKKPKMNFSQEHNDSNLNSETFSKNEHFKNSSSKKKQSKSAEKDENFNKSLKQDSMKNTYSQKKETKHESYSNNFFRKHINSILDEISKTHREKPFNSSPKDGDDIYTEIVIPFTESVSGTERVLNIMHRELCPHCKGRKFINGTKCSKCNGNGVYELKRRITIKIPAGVKNHAKLRLLNEGNPGFFGGKNGNLYVTINIEPDKNLKVDGSNILYNLKISPFEAVLGCKIDIPSADGIINLEIPAMTKTGQQFRIARKGLKTNGNVGDMIINVEIQLPDNLSADEISMYSKLKKMSQSCVREEN